MATQTFRDFMTECECYEYSQENYNLMKEAYEIDLMEKYLENQAFALENADVINTEDGYTFTEGMFVEASAIDVDQLVALEESVDQKKENFLKKIWNCIVKLFKKFIAFLKRLVNKKARRDRKAVRDVWKSNGGTKGIINLIKRYGVDTAADMIDKEAESKDASKEVRERLNQNVKDLHEKNTKNETKKEEKVKGEGIFTKIKRFFSGNPNKAMLAAVTEKIFEINPSLKEFFDPSSSREVVYAIKFPTNFDNALDLIVDSKALEIRVIKNSNDMPIVSYDKLSSNIFSLKQLNKDFKKRTFIIDTSTEYINKAIEYLQDFLDGANDEKFVKWRSEVLIEKDGLPAKDVHKYYANLTKGLPEHIKFLNTFTSYQEAFIQAVDEINKEATKAKAAEENK